VQAVFRAVRTLQEQVQVPVIGVKLVVRTSRMRLPLMLSRRSPTSERPESGLPGSMLRITFSILFPIGADRAVCRYLSPPGAGRDDIDLRKKQRRTGQALLL
jgi:hypothetical protein